MQISISYHEIQEAVLRHVISIKKKTNEKRGGGGGGGARRFPLFSFFVFSRSRAGLAIV